MAKEAVVVTDAQKEYVAKNIEKEPKEIAKGCGLTVPQTKKVVVELKAIEQEKRNAQLGDPQKTGFATQIVGGSATVSMTQEASEKGDEAKKTPGRNEDFFNKRVKNGIHIINPDKPTF